MLHYEVGFTSNQFHLEEAELRINGVQLVHNRSEPFVFLGTSEREPVWYTKAQQVV